ncbi:MAG: aldo/keto reductase [Planctomycetaceae bacterium]|nr:aldo/keto reductase [Planctomycetaceae bacterium]
MSIFDDVRIRLGLGTLKLGTQGRPDALEAQNLIVFALNQGLRIIDTADSYCRDQADFHYGEHLVRQALQKWPGEKSEVRVVTKAGLKRPDGKWIPCGRPEHLRESVDESLQALGTDQISLLLLHARDPQVPLTESLEALRDIAEAGKAKHLGVCNLSLAELEQARGVIPVAAIQNELSVLNTQSAQLGLIRYCEQHDIAFLAHRPLGGHAHTQRIASVDVLKLLAERHHATPHEVALAAVCDVSPAVIPLAGATKLKSLKSSLKAVQLPFDMSDRMAVSTFCQFASQLPGADSSISPSATSAAVTPAATDRGPGQHDDIVIVMGIQGAGKSELVEAYVRAGYARLNRDELGGTLESLVPRLQQLLHTGQRRVVLDNTYATMASRTGVVQMAAQFGVSVRCVFLNTPMHEAQRNVVQRMLSRYGMPLGPEEMKFFRKADPNLPPPQALQRWQSTFERPTIVEGFSDVTEVAFQRRPDDGRTAKGLLLDVDGTLRRTISGEVYPRHADDVLLLPYRTEVVADVQRA